MANLMTATNTVETLPDATEQEHQLALKYLKKVDAMDIAEILGLI